MTMKKYQFKIWRAEIYCVLRGCSIVNLADV